MTGVLRFLEAALHILAMAGGLLVVVVVVVLVLAVGLMFLFDRAIGGRWEQ